MEIDLSPPYFAHRRITINDVGNVTGFGLTEVPKEKVMLQKGSFIVGSIVNSGNGISLSARPHQHLMQTAANLEAERLAKESPGKQYVVLEIKGMVTVQNFVWQ